MIFLPWEGLSAAVEGCEQPWLFSFRDGLISTSTIGMMLKLFRQACLSTPILMVEHRAIGANGITCW